MSRALALARNRRSRDDHRKSQLDKAAEMHEDGISVAASVRAAGMSRNTDDRLKAVLSSVDKEKI